MRSLNKKFLKKSIYVKYMKKYIKLRQVYKIFVDGVGSGWQINGTLWFAWCSLFWCCLAIRDNIVALSQLDRNILEFRLTFLSSLKLIALTSICCVFLGAYALLILQNFNPFLFLYWRKNLAVGEFSVCQRQWVLTNQRIVDWRQRQDCNQICQGCRSSVTGTMATEL